MGDIIPGFQHKAGKEICAVADLQSTRRGMATAAVVELRHIRTAAIDDPERVVEIGRSILVKGSYGSAGDECTTPYIRKADIPDWTIIDQIAVAALITGDDALAKVPPTDSLSYKRTVSIDYLLISQHPHVHTPSWECN